VATCKTKKDKGGNGFVNRQEMLTARFATAALLGASTSVRLETEMIPTIVDVFPARKCKKINHMRGMLLIRG
jgi:hypothetical protein